MTSSPLQQQVPKLETITMIKSPEIDWKQRCEQLQFEHQLELERIRLHYDHELKEKVNGKDHHIINNNKLNAYLFFL